MTLRTAVALLGLAAAAAHDLFQEDTRDAISMIQGEFRTDTGELTEADAEQAYVHYDLDVEDNPDREFKVGDPVYMEAIDGPKSGSWTKGSIVGRGADKGTYDVHLWVGSMRRREKLSIPAGLLHDAVPIDANLELIRQQKEKAEEQRIALLRKEYEVQETAKRERREAENKAKEAAKRKQAAEEEAKKMEERLAKKEAEEAQKRVQEAENLRKDIEQKEAERKAKELAEKKEAELIARKKAQKAKYEALKAQRLADAGAMQAESIDDVRRKLRRAAYGANYDAKRAKYLAFKEKQKHEAWKAAHGKASNVQELKAVKTVAAKSEANMTAAELHAIELKQRVNIHVKNNLGKVVDFSLRRRMPLKTMMTVACTRLGVDKEKAHFTRKGNRQVHADDTPGTARLMNGETILIVGPPDKVAMKAKNEVLKAAKAKGKSV